MGIKGDKSGESAAMSVELLQEKLATIDGITTKKMFGGYGVFHDGKMFALVNSAGEVYFKCDDSNKAKFEQAGSHSHGKMPYFAVPKSVMDDFDQLIAWANESIQLSK